MSIHERRSVHAARGARLAIGAVTLSLSGLAFCTLAQAQDLSNSAVGNIPAATTLPANLDHTLSLRDRFHIYERTIFSPETIVGPAFGAAVGQAENEPPAWGQGGDGYGERFGSEVARHVIGESIGFGVAAIDREDPRYFLSRDRRFWPRARHAVVSTFVSETSSGRRIPAFSRFANTYGSAFIANTWYPADRATAGHAAERGSTALAVDLGFNIAREFLPFFRNHTR